VVLDKGGRLYVNGQAVPNVEALETDLKARLFDKRSPRELEVRFRCEKTAKYKDYRPVYEAISNAGGIIAVIHEIRTPSP
jgi:biopolymer transport protein ExbD